MMNEPIRYLCARLNFPIWYGVRSGIGSDSTTPAIFSWLSDTSTIYWVEYEVEVEVYKIVFYL
jgi:hypothetical protein